MKFLATVIYLLFNLSLVIGNTPMEKAKVDFKKVNLTYSATPAFSLDIQYSVFDNHIGGNMIEQKNGQYFKSRGLSYTKILNIETIVNAKTTVVVNNDESVLLITDSKKIELSPLQTNMDTLLKMCSSITTKDIGTTERFYSLNFGTNSSSEFSRIDVYINLSNFTIKKIIMFYNDGMSLNQSDFYAEEKKPRLEITYKTFKIVTNINESLFSESTYMVLKDNQYKGIGKYSNYKIINQLQSARFKKK
ncbi:MAG: hypothetical protein JNM51_14240 [Bacteroidia bacterium]|nr:hypothetical protein [Bacteroidia bacterium]